MFRNYFKIAFRNLWKNKGYSALNIFGLAIGITCASFIFLWVEDELNYDQVFADRDLVYYVPTNQNYQGEWSTFYSTPGPLAPDLKAEIPEISKAARSFSWDLFFRVGDNAINRNGRYADADLFDIFNLKFLEGQAASAFPDDRSIVLTRETADLLFGKDKKALGKLVQVNNNESWAVTGVVQNLPKNMSFDFSWLAPYEVFTKDQEWTQEYGNNFADTFVKLAPGADFKAVDAKVRKMIPEKMDDPGTEAILHPAANWHLKSKFEGGKAVGGRITYVRLFLAIALIILCIACINFMNLSTASSEKRANEVGVRKALGSGKQDLIRQFLTESVVIAFLGGLLSLILLALFISPFNNLIDKQLILGLDSLSHWMIFMTILVLCGILAGLYPAFYLSSFNPVQVLKGRSSKGQAPFVRKGLVVLQFTVSILFIVSTIVVYQQVKHIKNRDMGFDKENLIRLQENGDIIKNFDALRQDMLARGSVKNLGMTNTDLLSGGNNGSGLTWDGGTETEDILISFRRITPHFLETAGLQLAEGRGFSESVKKDSAHVLISESFAQLMGEGSPLGKKIRRGITYTVIGVVKDFVYGNMYGTGHPVLYFHDPESANFLYIKTKAGIPTAQALSDIESSLKTFNPGYPFEYEFVDAAFDRRFKNEQLMGSLSQIFAALSILISCLGLFGLSAYTAQQRRKEIGVRKVLGSSVAGIVRLLSKDFIVLVLVAIVIAVPLAWYIMYNWLQGFAYRISINVWVFVFAGIAAIGIALLTVSFQAIKAAIANPVKSLRTE